ncbi:hypothetical protein HW452_16100 [Halomonas aquamarina]|uniref:Uncharacterized protein n=1 Tax=Vreelandella aquamarina TaxID=77097 RepID=A0ACC5VY91_9GAMM|nr:hypothetical protein [Halomonas aquamarina]MBZ5489047.1 hypothetical protein [Halomonas aquamarina]
MKYQDHFPTIWDTPLKQPARKATHKASASRPLAFKALLLSFWNSAKRKPAA